MSKHRRHEQRGVPKPQTDETVDSSGLNGRERSLIRQVFSDKRTSHGNDPRSYAMSQRVKLFILQGQMLYGSLDERYSEGVIDRMVGKFVADVIDPKIDSTLRDSDNKDKVRQIINDSLFESIVGIGRDEEAASEVSKIYTLLQQEHILQIFRKRITGDASIASREEERKEAAFNTVAEAFRLYISNDEEEILANSESVNTQLRGFTYNELNQNISAYLLRYVVPSDHKYCKPVLQKLKEGTGATFLGNPKVDWGSIGTAVFTGTLAGLVSGYAVGSASESLDVPIASQYADAVNHHYGDGSFRFAYAALVGLLGFVGTGLGLTGSECPMKIPGVELEYTKIIRVIHSDIDSRFKFRVNFHDRTSTDKANPEPAVYVTTIEQRAEREPIRRTCHEDSDEVDTRRGQKIKTRPTGRTAQAEADEQESKDVEQGRAKIKFDETSFDLVKGFISDAGLQKGFQRVHDIILSDNRGIDGDKLKYVDRENGIVELKVGSSRARMFGYVLPEHAESDTPIICFTKFSSTGLHTGAARNNRMLDPVRIAARGARRMLSSPATNLVTASNDQLLAGVSLAGLS